MKKFNTTAVCIPSKHYIVDITDRVKEIKKLVDNGDYFTINRARQYGKTTTLRALKQILIDEYIVLSLSFDGMSHANFETEMTFVKALCRMLKNDNSIWETVPGETKEKLDDYINRKEEQAALDELFIALREWCAISDKPLVLFIDEVDSATNNQVFLDFLALLRNGYIARESEDRPSFQSVILAGVTDVKHLKSKIRGEAEAKENSPWNIAADFNIDMSLSEDGIKGMLDEYENDHHTGMDTGEIARLIREYTNGYPFLVSRICQVIDQGMLPEAFCGRDDLWTEDGIIEAVKYIIAEKNTLFDSLMGKVRSFDSLRNKLKELLFTGEAVAYMQYNKEQEELLVRR